MGRATDSNDQGEAITRIFLVAEKNKSPAKKGILFRIPLRSQPVYGKKGTQTGVRVSKGKKGTAI